jgi:REP element-mobilizing transposase RayT
MPGCARKEIVRDGVPGIFHCWSRCVRRAYLLGKDPLTGKNHNHRRQWVIERLELLVANFAIDVCFLAVMANHLHLVLRTSPRLVTRMGTWEIARRWLRVFPGKRVLDGQWIEPTEEQVKALAEDKEKIKKIRKRLSSVSWFMSALSEYIARRSNREDDCRGRFWEGRFGSREITDESALLVCGMYVDLNPVRAGEVRSPEMASHCSASFRVRACLDAKDKKKSGEPAADGWLAPLTLEKDQLGDVPCQSGRRASDKGLLPMTLEEYLKLLDWCGRQLRSDKRGAIPADLAPIVERLGIVAEELVDTIDQFPQRFRRMAGTVKQLTKRAAEAGRRWFQGVGAAARAFG